MTDKQPLSVYIVQNVEPPCVAEVMLGGYRPGGGCDGRGEFAIALRRFAGVPGLNPLLRVFDDAYGALREAIDAGLLDALESVDLYSVEDLTATLADLGFQARP